MPHSRLPFAAGLVLAGTLAGCAIRPPPPAERDWAPPVATHEANPALSEAVSALASDDFRARARAADALVAAGEEGLVALAAAGDAPVAVHGGKATASTTRPVVVAILRTLPTDRLVAKGLLSEGAAVRRAAAEEAGRRMDADAVAALRERLLDADPEVRVAARAALARLADASSTASAAPALRRS